MHEVVRELLKDFRMTFSSLEEGLAQRLDPERVFLDPAKPMMKKTGGSGRLGNAEDLRMKPNCGRGTE